MLAPTGGGRGGGVIVALMREKPLKENFSPGSGVDGSREDSEKQEVTRALRDSGFHDVPLRAVNSDL